MPHKNYLNAPWGAVTPYWKKTKNGLNDGRHGDLYYALFFTLQAVKMLRCRLVSWLDNLLFNVLNVSKGEDEAKMKEEEKTHNC